MKKYLLIVVCAVLLFLVTGCGAKNQMKCTGTMTESGVEIKAEVIADFDSTDKLTDATITYDLGNAETANQWCSMFKLMEDSDKGISVSCSGSKITIKGYAKAASSSEEESMLGRSKEEFKKAMEEEHITCK